MDVSTPSGVWSRSTALLLSVTTLSLANIVNRYWAVSALMVVISVLLVLTAIASAVVARWAPRVPAPRAVWSGAIVFSAGAMYTAPLPLDLTVMVGVMLVAAIVAPSRWMLPLVTGAAVIIAAAVVSRSTVGHMRIDVFTMIQGATGMFVHGQDPYLTAWPPDVPGSGTPQTMVYGPGVVLLAAPGRLLGDVRFAGAGMWLTIMAGVISISKRRRESRPPFLLPALLVASPLAPSMIYWAWADIYGLAALTTWLALRDRHRTLAIIALGLCLSAKPTLGALLVVALLWSAEWRRDVLPGTAVACAVVLPFALWDHRFNFLQSTVGTTFNHVVYLNRADALSINTAWLAITGNWAPGSVLVVIMAAVGIPVLLTGPRDTGDIFALAAALTMVIVVANREAFFNYYFVAAVALYLALAYEGGDPDAVRIRLFGPVDAVASRLTIRRRTERTVPQTRRKRSDVQ